MKTIASDRDRSRRHARSAGSRGVLALAGCAACRVRSSKRRRPSAPTSPTPSSAGSPPHRRRSPTRRCPAFACCPTATSVRCPPGADPPRREDDRRPVLPDRRRRHRARVPGASSPAPPARGVRVRLLVDDLYAPADDALLAALAGAADVEVRLFNPLPVRGGSFARRLTLSLHDLAAHQPPHAQQALHRRRQLRGQRRPQHRRRVLRPQRRRQLHRHGPAVVGPRRRRAVGAVRPVLEFALRLPGAKAWSARRRGGGARRADASGGDVAGAPRGDAADAALPERSPPSSRAASCALRFAPAARVLADAPSTIADDDRRPRRQPGDARPPRAAGLGAVERAGRDAVLRPRRRRPGGAARGARPRRALHGPDQLARDHRRAAGPLRLRALPRRPAQARRRPARADADAEAARRRRRPPTSATAPRSAGCTPSWSSSTTAGSRSAR